jgi:nicotinamide-nucleotide amidase
VTAAQLVAAAAEVHAALSAQGATVAVAESLTGGLFAAALTAVPGASRTFRGGLIVYATDLKASIGGVPPDMLAAHGPVSAPVAQALADSVRHRLGATFGLSLTGVAGPDTQDGKPVGTVYIGLAGPTGHQVRLVDLPGDRDQIRAASVLAALRMLAEVLPDSPSRADPGPVRNG